MYKFQKISRPPPQREFLIGPPHLPGFSIFAGNWWPPTPSEFPLPSVVGVWIFSATAQCCLETKNALWRQTTYCMTSWQTPWDIYKYRWVLRVCSSPGSMHGPHCAHYKIINSLHLARGINFTLGSAGKSCRYGVSGMINYTNSSFGYLAETIPTNNVKKNVERNQSELNT